MRRGVLQVLRTAHEVFPGVPETYPTRVVRTVHTYRDGARVVVRARVICRDGATREVRAVVEEVTDPHDTYGVYETA